jgi:HNH endonuclease
MSKKRKQRREIALLECGGLLGAMIGLLDAVTHASTQPECRKTLDTCISKDVHPYVSHAAVGMLIGCAVALALILLWNYRNAPAARRPAAAAPRREAISERVRHEVWRRDRGTCVECGGRGRLEFDHIIPVSRGGANTVRNIELRCEPCNRRKGARI